MIVLPHLNHNGDSKKVGVVSGNKRYKKFLFNIISSEDAFIEKSVD